MDLHAQLQTSLVNAAYSATIKNLRIDSMPHQAVKAILVLNEATQRNDQHEEHTNMAHGIQ